MDRSTRNLSIITLLVLAIFLALNNIARRTALVDWWLVVFFLLVAVLVWFYDRVSRRGIDDSEGGDANVIEPLVYDHAAPLGIPDTIELVAPNPSTVIKPEPRHAPVAEFAPAAAPVKPDANPPTAKTVEPPTPPAAAPIPVQEKAAPPPSASAQPAPVASAPSPVEEKTAPPVPAAAQASPPSAIPTTIEEKSAPPPSASAPETHPDLAARSPGGINLPSVPVTAENAGEPVPTPVSGTAPEPANLSATPMKEDVARASMPSSVTDATPPVTTVAPPAKSSRGKGKAKAAEPEESSAPMSAVEPPVTTPGGKVTPANSNLEVSATAAANAAPIKNDPNLPMKAVTNKPDDLKIIEGIGPKMEKALQAAGISTFAMLAGTSEAQLKEAITAAGMRFAPSVPTWAEQASYAANGDFVGLEAFQKTLVSGRKK